MNPFDFAIIVLATWRVTHMVSKEDGPGGVCRKFREWTGARETINFGWESDTFFGKLVTCFFCLSLWVAGLIYVVYVWLPWLWWAILILAISGAASLLQFVERD